MSNAPLTPRQKMINMMYLVLTAILALNVSSEVLNAFKTVNDGIGMSNTSQQAKNSILFADLAREYSIDPVRAKEAYEKAEQARLLTKNLNDLMEQYKRQMIEDAGGVDVASGKIHRDDDIDVSTRLFVENNGEKGKDLKNKIGQTRAQLIALLNDGDKHEADRSLPMKLDEAKEGPTWEYAKFNQVPVVAAVTLLSKYQSDLLSVEGHIVERLFKSVNAGSTTVDRMAAKIIAPSSYILQGEPYRADVMVAASSSTLVPEVYLGAFTAAVKKDNQGAFIPIISTADAMPLSNAVKVDVKDGLGKLDMAGNSAGDKKYTGVVKVKNSNTGNYEYYPFEGNYQVATKTAIVAPKMMNVMYIGLDNTIDASVPGIAQSDITASLDGKGSLIKNTDGSYNALVTTPGVVKVIVKAKVNGREMVMGEQPFRVKIIPSPITTLDGVYEGGRIPLSKLKTTSGIVPLVKGWDYSNKKFAVESYQVSYKSRKDNTVMLPITITGTPLYNEKVKDLIQHRIESGDDIYFDEIWVKGPAGDKRKINPISFAVSK